ncbi:MAG: tail fiber domain-containing protein, partial [Cyclobacteriaceae bacterium]
AMDVISDGGTSSFGQIIVKDAAQADAIVLNGFDGSAFFAGAVNQSSDLRLKTSIQQLQGSLEGVLSLRGVSYKWLNKKKTQRTQIGLIAQEVEEVYPEFVHTDAQGMKSVNYAQMTAVLIEAVKELNAKVESLESENGELKAELAEVSDLSNRIRRLEQLLGAGQSSSQSEE